MPPRLNPCTYLPRRLQVVASLTAFILGCFLFLGTSTSDNTVDPYLNQVPFGKQIQSGAHGLVDNLPKVPAYVNTPTWLNPFRTPAHKPPPEQANSSSGEARWYSDFKWRNPFSSAVTLDEDRAVLPPLRERPPVYTYFDPSNRRTDELSKNAEQELLQIWRRAWWAQGFKPIVLGRAEAMNHPLYRTVQTLKSTEEQDKPGLSVELETEMMRWLAWANMGTGVLCNWLAVPMAAYEDPLLGFLRRGGYVGVTRYEGLGNGLFVGTKEAIEGVVKAAVGNQNIKNFNSMYEAVPDGTFAVDTQHEGIAFYSTATITSKYLAIRDKLEDPETIGEGMAMLPPLINSHLHMTWQNRFSSGIAVLKPLPRHTTALITPAIDIARNLSQCAATPIPASCPPNRPRCQPCVSSSMLISLPPVFRNTSTLFTIGTVPHPYTLASLLHTQDHLDLKFIRRETSRDAWILAATKELLGTGLSSFARLIAVKDAVASEYGASRSLWLTAESPSLVGRVGDLEELDWHFGFQLPREPMADGKSETPVPGPERRPPPPKQEFGEGPVPTEVELAREVELLEQAKALLRTGAKLKELGEGDFGRTRDVVEAWNLADTEAWKFVRAWGARGVVERRGWVDEEEQFEKGVFSRWIDRIVD